MSFRTSTLRLALAVVLPFLMAVNGLAMPVMPAEAVQGVLIPMMDMSGCDEGSDPRLAARCSINCPLVCGAIAPSGPVAAEPLSRPAPTAAPPMTVAETGISTRPDYPPPR